MPTKNNTNIFGDLIISYNIIFPNNKNFDKKVLSNLLNLPIYEYKYTDNMEKVSISNISTNFNSEINVDEKKYFNEYFNV